MYFFEVEIGSKGSSSNPSSSPNPSSSLICKFGYTSW